MVLIITDGQITTITGFPTPPSSRSSTCHSTPDTPPAGPYFFTDLADITEADEQAAAELGEAPAMFLVNHGIVAVGNDLPTAVVTAVLLERACQQQLLTHGFGGWPGWSDPAESLSKRQHIYSDGALRHVWEYLVRGLSH
jgi:L-fuculose-phosphate aldolase